MKRFVCICAALFFTACSRAYLFNHPRTVFAARPPEENTVLRRGLQSITEEMLIRRGFQVIPESALRLILRFSDSDADAICKISGAEVCVIPHMQRSEGTVALRFIWKEKDIIIEGDRVQKSENEFSRASNLAFFSMLREAAKEGRSPSMDSDSSEKENPPALSDLVRFSELIDRSDLDPEGTLEEFEKFPDSGSLFVSPMRAKLSLSFQVKNPDSVKARLKELSSGPSASFAVLSLCDAAYYSLARGNLERAGSILTEAQSAARVLENPYLRYMVLDLQSRTSLQENKTSDALRLSEESLAILGGPEHASSYPFLSGSILRSGAALAAGNFINAETELENSLRKISEMGLEESPDQALVFARLGKLRFAQGNSVPAMLSWQSALKILRKRGLSGTGFYAGILLRLAEAYEKSGDFAQGEKLKRAATLAAEANGLNLYDISENSDPFTQDFFFFDPSLSNEEARCISTYTGAFDYERHSRWVQSRTYEGRLADTNVLLHDLLDAMKSDDDGLSLLRERLAKKSAADGRGIVFIDVGPAIANLSMPGAAAVSIAREFPAMQVIALDLPEQVEIFRSLVNPELRDSVLSLQNLHVFSGNGVLPMAAQLADPGRYFRQTAAGALSGKPIIMRAANSIDIYESWRANRLALHHFAGDFFSSPVLYLFNRSILYKGENSRTFHIVGFLSPAGFDHLYETFDRHGQPAYTIYPPALGYREWKPGTIE